MDVYTHKSARLSYQYFAKHHDLLCPPLSTHALMNAVVQLTCLFPGSIIIYSDINVFVNGMAWLCVQPVDYNIVANLKVSIVMAVRISDNNVDSISQAND